MFGFFRRQEIAALKEGVKLSLGYDLARLQMIQATAQDGDSFVDKTGIQQVWDTAMAADIQTAIDELIASLAALG